MLQTNIEKRDSKAQFTIGILQTTSHPALEMAKEGFIKTITAELAETVDFICCNALGSALKLESFAQEYHENKKISAIFALGTPAALAIATIEKEKPIIIAAVTDPHELGLIHKQTNVTGSSDMTDPKYQINYLKQLMPHAKTVAILYTATEQNSSIVAKKMIEALLHEGLNPLEIAFDAESTLLASIDNALTNADVLFIPTDNTLSSMMQTIAQRAYKSKKPVWVCDNTLIAHSSILASYGIDYETNGIQAARAAITVLTQHKKPYEIAVTHAPKDILLINKKTLRDLHLKVPVELEPWAKLV